MRRRKRLSACPRAHDNTAYFPIGLSQRTDGANSHGQGICGAPEPGRVAANGVEYAYRDTSGDGAVPLVLLQHFRGNLDNWDPALIDALAASRRVVTFDNAGVGGSTGTTPDTIEQMASDAIAFIAAMQFSQADLLGFSIGSFIAQQIALVCPAIVRRLVLASSAPQGAVGMHGWAPQVIGAIGTPETSPDAYLDVFFTRSASSRLTTVRDERFAQIDLRATAVAGLSLIITLIVSWLVEIARGHSGSPYYWLCAIGGLAYALAIAFFRWRG
jgi:pimeloyl-ACP methyl ester carboxylesterase